MTSNERNPTAHEFADAIGSEPSSHVVCYPFSPQDTSQPSRSKRRQVKNACTNCQKACKKCDDARPCLRCVKYGVSEECIDSVRKERKKGVKRGPYKKRDGKDRAASSTSKADDDQQPGRQSVPHAMPHMQISPLGSGPTLLVAPGPGSVPDQSIFPHWYQNIMQVMTDPATSPLSGSVSPLTGSVPSPPGSMFGPPLIWPCQLFYPLPTGGSVGPGAVHHGMDDQGHGERN